MIDERYLWMQGFPLKLPYNCNEYMQIDLSRNHRSKMVLSSLFSFHISNSRLSAIKEKKGNLLAKEKLSGSNNSTNKGDK